MSLLNIFKLLNTIENIVCVYRTYSSFNAIIKYLVTFRILVESALILLYYACALQGIFAIKKGVLHFAFPFFYKCLLVINSIAAITLSRRRSTHYSELISNIDAIETLCSNDSMYKHVVKKHNKKVYIQVALAMLVVNVRHMLYLRDTWPYGEDKMKMFLTVFLSTLEYRFYCESIVFYELIDVVVQLMRYLNKSISTVKDQLSTISDWNEGAGEGVRITRELVRWSKISHRIAAICDRLRDCFGVQMLLSLCATTVFYIMFLYQGLVYLINQELIWESSAGTFLVTLSLLMVIKLLILVSGQRMQNEADIMDVKLALLQIQLTIPRREGSLECTRTARALSRRLRAAPLRVRLQRALPVRAALLVDMLAVVLNYTIILLQFNHVI